MQASSEGNSRQENLKMVGWLLWKALLALLMFELEETKLCLKVAWIHLRHRSIVVGSEENPE
jgi:hypothetical protein